MDIVIGYIGRLSPEKRPLAAIEAVSQLPPQYKAVVIGDGWKSEETKAAAPLLCSPDRFQFVGHSDRIGDCLSAIDVWVNASPAEGFCLSLTEAWLAGTPVASTPTGSIPELEDAHGLLTFPIPENPWPLEIAEAVYGAMSHRAITLNARQVAWDHFTAPAMVYRWERYINRVLTEHAVHYSVQ